MLVRKITLSEGKMEFADLSLTPQFGTKIHELKGVVAGISTARNARAQVKLDGRVDEYGTAKIDGELNTSDPKAFTNISVVFRNVEMARLTPYSGHFAGRKIDSGKLSVDLKYQIQKGQLAGDNKIVVERLMLGEKIPSPDAVDLPLDLAVALMEDSNGVIDIGLPVKGDLNSPEFSYGALIWKAFTNLLTKIVTSPFRALGALLPGGGEETLNVVAFEPGRPDVPPPEKEKLAKLAGLLQKRPQLKLSVQGRYNPETDLAELRIGKPAPHPGHPPGAKTRTGRGPRSGGLQQPGNRKSPGGHVRAALRRRRAQSPQGRAEGGGRQGQERCGRQGCSRRPRPSPKTPASSRRSCSPGWRMPNRSETPSWPSWPTPGPRPSSAELSGPDGIPAQRVEVKPPAALDKKDPPTAALNLEAGR